MILAIETSTPVCSVALSTEAGTVWEKRIEGRGVHSERTFTFIEELLDRKGIGIPDLSAVLFSNGPGSYTGLRIGASAVKGVLFRQKIPFFTCPTLISFTAGFDSELEHTTVHSVIDARREHLYIQTVRMFENNILEATEPAIKTLSEIKTLVSENDILAGTGWERLELDPNLKVKTVGTEGVSAKTLILAWNNPSFKNYFEKKDPKTFEPEYLTMSQLNNTSI